MNWEAIKHIYRCVLIYNCKFEYLGEDEYILATYHQNGQKHWKSKYKNGIMHGKNIVWAEKGRKWFELEFENGKLIQ